MYLFIIKESKIFLTTKFVFWFLFQFTKIVRWVIFQDYFFECWVFWVLQGTNLKEIWYTFLRGKKVSRNHSTVYWFSGVTFRTIRRILKIFDCRVDTNMKSWKIYKYSLPLLKQIYKKARKDLENIKMIFFKKPIPPPPPNVCYACKNAQDIKGIPRMLFNLFI